MLKHEDANESTDRRIADAVADWTGKRGPPLSYTRDKKARSILLTLMERFGRRSQLAEARINEQEAFLYICARPNGETFAQGLGSTALLAICDAFLGCREEHSMPDSIELPRLARAAAAAAPPPPEPPKESISRPPAPELEPEPASEAPLFECVNCGWEGHRPDGDPRRCPSCRRHFLRPGTRHTR